MIQPIVEGHGDVEAFPILLRRLLERAQAWEVRVGRPIRRRRDHLATKDGVMKAVELARVQGGCHAILVLFDGDDDCPAKLGPAVQGWASEAAGDVPCEVCIAHREYEAWFLATADSLRGHRTIRADATSHPSPDEPRGAKRELERRMKRGDYKETIHQPAFSALFCLSQAFRRSRSFRKLVKSFGSLLSAMGQQTGGWPPPSWADNQGGAQ